MIGLLSFLAVATAPTGGIPVDVGRWNPADFPPLQVRFRRMPHADMNLRVQRLFEQGQCRIDGQTKVSFDIDVPYAVLLGADGTLHKVAVGEIGCRPLEKLVGQIVVAQARRGDFQPDHGGAPRWYTSELGFAQGDVISPLSKPDKVVCKASVLKVGSRLKRVSHCMTAAEWQLAGGDRMQFGRDVQNAARKGVVE